MTIDVFDEISPDDERLSPVEATVVREIQEPRRREWLDHGSRRPDDGHKHVFRPTENHVFGDSDYACRFCGAKCPGCVKEPKSHFVEHGCAVCGNPYSGCCWMCVDHCSGHGRM